MVLVERCSETKLYLSIYLTTSLGVSNFGNTTAMRVIYSKCLKFNLDFKIKEKKLKNTFLNVYEMDALSFTY